MTKTTRLPVLILIAGMMSVIITTTSYNRTSVVVGTATESYTQNLLGLSQYSVVGSDNLTYDDNGNLTQIREVGTISTIVKIK